MKKQVRVAVMGLVITVMGLMSVMVMTSCSQNKETMTLEYSYPAWTSDDRIVAVRKKIVTYDSGGVEGEISVDTEQFDWSPDEKYIATDCAAGTSIYDWRTKEIMQSFSKCVYPAWKNPKGIVCTYGDQSDVWWLCLLTPTGGGGYAMATENVNVYMKYDVQLLKNGEDVVYFAGTGGRMYIYNLNTKQTTERIITGFGTLNEENTKMVYWANLGEVYTINFDGTNDRRIK